MKRFTLVAICLFVLFLANNGWATVIYVKTDGSDTNGGTSWADSFATIQKAIDSAGDNDQIWVMAGTYRIGDQIVIDNKVQIYGGFPDDVPVPQWSDRDWGAYETIVDGQNSVRCFYFHSPGTVDGLTIKNCDASGAVDPIGGAMQIDFTSAFIFNCTFTNNRALNGGALYCRQGHADIANCNFSDNSATGAGGAIEVSDTSADISNCTFSGNTAIHSGGAIFTDEADGSITNCIFTDNTAAAGGAIAHTWVSGIPITRCNFSGNRATGRGGAVYVGESSPEITNCIFADNEAQYGGGIYNSEREMRDTEPIITNCIFSNNYASEEGGGMYNAADVVPEVMNCTFYGNFAEQVGGAISNHDCNPVITNSILWNNAASSANEIYNVNAATIPVVTYCDVEGGYTGAGNINSDPLFRDAANDDFHLQLGSPCIDTGTSIGAPNNDIDGDSRPRLHGYDMGADEYVLSIIGGSGSG